MAEYRTPSGVDPIDFLLKENEAINRRLNGLEGRKLSTWDRYDHTTIAAPVEGQHVVELDETVWYYSDGAWRQLGAGSYPVIRRRKNGTQAIGASETNVTWDETTTIDSAVFEIPSSPNDHKIEVLEDGLYAVFVRYYWSGNPLDHIGVVNGVDPGAFAGYAIVVGTTANNQVSGSAGYSEFRLSAGQQLYMTVYHTAAGTPSLDIGTIWEVRKVPGSVTLAGLDIT